MWLKNLKMKFLVFLGAVICLTVFILVICGGKCGKDKDDKDEDTDEDERRLMAVAIRGAGMYLQSLLE